MMKKHNFDAVAYTADVQRHSLASGEVVDFIIDFATLDAPDVVPVDYNHDWNAPIGSAQLEVEEDRLLAHGALVSSSPDDLAAQLAERGKDIPFGISPTVDFTAAERVDVPAGASISRNGRLYEGPVTVFEHAKLRGLSVCMYPTDPSTVFTPLQQNKEGLLFMAAKNSVKLAAEPVEVVDVVEVEDKAGEAAAAAEITVKNKELQDFIDAFGLERGVRFYQENKTIDEARAIAYDELVVENEKLRAKIAALEAAAAPKVEAVEVVEDKPREAVEVVEAAAPVEAFSACLEKFNAALEKFSADAQQLSQLRLRGEAVGLSADVPVVENPHENKGYCAAISAAVAK